MAELSAGVDQDEIRPGRGSATVRRRPAADRADELRAGTASRRTTRVRGRA